MSGKDSSLVSKEALLGTKPGKQIIKQGIFKSKGYRMFSKYKLEAETELPNLAKRFTDEMYAKIKADDTPIETLKAFVAETREPEMDLQPSKIDKVKTNLSDIQVLGDRVMRILDSNFVKMTYPVFNALYDAAAAYDGRDSTLREDMVEGHILAIDLSEPMDRIVDKDEDLEYLDDYRLMNPYILQIARKKIKRGGQKVLREFEEGFAQARIGQDVDTILKSKPDKITKEEMIESYKKYRSVMGTAGRNMALAKNPLGEIFYSGMAHAAEGVGCGNEMEDSLKHGFIKVPSWPLYYSLSAQNIEKGFQLTMAKSDLYLNEARLAIDAMPKNFTHTDFLNFLFLSVEHYNRYWYNRITKMSPWKKFESNLPVNLK
ncbi:MAG: hypothetical protein K8823_387 [Cenarchaeum symbiont of Oopsacas minuta]|nr:hypothetical protein [Cenarchaeum symbiont of Oopsacas minuta]